MGMVFQHFNLFPHLTIKKNITLAPVKLGLMTADEADKKAEELLERVGLPDKADEYIEQMVDLQIEINAQRSPKISRLKDYLKRSIESLDMIDDVKKYELLTRLESMPKHVKLCHGEFTPDNIIINKDEK